MPIFQYVPVREGYTFKGWSNKKDGSGKYYKYMYWGSWRNDGTSEKIIGKYLENPEKYLEVDQLEE